MWPKFSFWKGACAPLPSQAEEDFTVPFVQKTPALTCIRQLARHPCVHPSLDSSPQPASPARKARPLPRAQPQTGTRRLLTGLRGTQVWVLPCIAQRVLVN